MKDSSSVCGKTITRRNKAIHHQLHKIAGNSSDAVATQTGKLFNSFDEATRSDILSAGNIPSATISPKHMVAMKVDLGIPWEKLKTIARYFSNGC